MSTVSNPQPTVLIGDPNPTAEPGAAFVIGTSLIDTGVVAATEVQYADRTNLTRSINVRRGRQHPLDRPGAGSATIVIDNRAGTFKADELRPGLPVQVQANGEPVFTGCLISVTFADKDLHNDATATVYAHDDYRRLAETTLPAVSATGASDTAGGRIDRVLDQLSPVSDDEHRDLDAGVATLQSTTLDASMLSHALEATDAELGWLFLSRLGVWRHLARSAQVDASAFADPVVALAHPDYPFRSSSSRWSTDRVRNDVQLTREGGTQQRSTDTDSIDDYGRKSYAATGLQLETDGQVSTLADAHLDRFKDVQLTPDTVQVPAGRGSWPGVIAVLELGDAVTVKKGMATRWCFVQGITHQWSARAGWVTDLTLWETPSELATAFVIGTSLIDTGTVGAS